MVALKCPSHGSGWSWSSGKQERRGGIEIKTLRKQSLEEYPGSRNAVVALKCGCAARSCWGWIS